MKKKHIYIFFIFFFILWKPIHLYIFPYDGGGRIISVLGLLFLLFGLQNYSKGFIKDGKYFDIPILIWVIWVIIDTLIFNPIMNPETDIFAFFLKNILPFIVYLGIRLNLSKTRVKKQWLWLLLALLLYLFLVLVFEKNNPDKDNRLGLYINANEIAWIALLTLFSSSIIVRKKYIKYFIFIIVFFLIVLTASKKALMSFLFFFALRFFFIQNISLIKRISIISIFFIFLGMSSHLVLNNTIIGERIQKSMEKNEMAENDSELFDGRANYYIKGFELFKERPFTGIGLTNFYYLGGMELVAHSEYVVQLAELGIVGFVLFIIFHIRIIRNLIQLKNDKKSNKIIYILLASFLTFYIMFLGRWVYDNIPYYIFLALTVNTIINYKKILKLKIKTNN